MMRLLQEQGVPLYFDETKAADEFNPLGYFETSELFATAPDEILDRAAGRVFKLHIPMLIPNLPTDRAYKVLWMERDAMESAKSLTKVQAANSQKRGVPFKPDIALLADMIVKGRSAALDFMAAHDFDILSVPMNSLSDHIDAAIKHIAPAICRDLPPLIRQIPTAMQAMGRFARSGFHTTPPDILAEREATCRACPEWDAAAMGGTGRCRKCGCSTWAKLRMATERCPIGKWEAVSEPLQQ
jgi:hypothetical protein